MLLCIYDLWESLVFLSPTDSFLNQLTDSLSFLVCTLPIADISLLATTPVASEDRHRSDPAAYTHTFFINKVLPILLY
jgi:hypothetical protein